MARQVVLHIGVRKSGTTYLQKAMQEHAGALAERGVLYPLPPPRRLNGSRVNHHELATYVLLGDAYPWVSSARARAQSKWWQNLLEQVNSWDGVAVISAEAVSTIGAAHVERCVEAFGGRPRVVITARGLGALLPSAWQQNIRNGRARGYKSYLAQQVELRDELGWEVIEKDPSGAVWRAFALGRLVRRWSSVVGIDDVTLVTNPGRHKGSLWHRFLEAAEIDLTGVTTEPEAEVVHRGLTAAEARVLRSVNQGLVDSGWSQGMVKALDNRVIQAFQSHGPRLGIPREFRQRVATWSAEDLEDLHATGVRVVGDLTELSYDPALEPSEPQRSDVIEAAEVAVRVLAEATAGAESTTSASR